MCRRFTQAHPWDAVHSALGLAGEPPELAPRYNLAPPTQDALVVRSNVKFDDPLCIRPIGGGEAN